MLSLLLQAGNAHADLPDLGDVSQASMTPADEAKIGREAMQAMRQEGSISDDPELNRYINDIGGKLASGVVSPGIKFSFFVVNDPGINAFAMPGGYIGVNKGLILATQSEGELASVLGHEMAHVTQHHIARMQANSTPNHLILLATLVAAALAARAGSSDGTFGAINAGIGLTVANQLSFSRDYEREADRVGMQYLAAAGYDVREMARFFQRLQQSEHLNGGDAYAFLRTHPVTVERISEAQNRALDMPVRMRPDTTRYLLVREKIRAQVLGAAEAVKYYHGALESKRYLSEGAHWYGLARAQMQADDLVGAQQSLAEARQLLPNDPMLFGLAAEIARAGHNWEKAFASYQAGRKLFPDGQALIYGDIDLRLQLGQKQAALKTIRDCLAISSADPVLYRFQSRIYADTDMMRYHAALGNAFYYEQQYPAALEQYQLASQASGNDFYLRSSIEARTRELQNMLQSRKVKGRDAGGT